MAGKTASCAAMALTFGSYAWPNHPRLMAALALAALVAVNLAGVAKTVWLTRLIVAIVLSVLAIVVIAGFTGGTADSDRLRLSGASPYDCLRAGALLFFAFAGYARLATLGEEVRDPARTIPRAIPAALGITLLVYALVAVSALVAVGPAALAESNAPLATAVGAGSWHDFVPVVRIGAAAASLGVLLSLLAGVSRTVFAMAGEHDLPRMFAHVHPRTRVPDLAETAVGAIVLLAVLTSDFREAIGFSSFCVLSYYAITNVAALRLPLEQRRWPTSFAAFGLAGCVVLALTLPAASIVGGLAAIGVGLMARYAVAIITPVDRR